MKKWQVWFYDKHSEEIRTLQVNADCEEDAEAEAVKEADARGWPISFRLGDATMMAEG